MKISELPCRRSFDHFGPDPSQDEIALPNLINNFNIGLFPQDEIKVPFFGSISVYCTYITQKIRIRFRFFRGYKLKGIVKATRRIFYKKKTTEKCEIIKLWLELIEFEEIKALPIVVDTSPSWLDSE